MTPSIDAARLTLILNELRLLSMAVELPTKAAE
jgi:hypothetical protein